MRYPSEIWVSDCSQLGENLANNDNVIICRQYLVDNYFCPCCSVVQASCHVNVVTGSEIIKKITPSEICPIFGDCFK